MLPELSAMEHFHFLRPGWLLLLPLWIGIALVQRRRRNSRDSSGMTT